MLKTITAATLVATVSGKSYGLRGAEAPKVKVTLYEESLCPACVGYFDAGTDLQPVGSGFWLMYEALKDIVDPEVVMWGNAQGDPMGEVECQHGEVECRGNLMFGCAKNQPGITVDQQMNFIHCFDSALITGHPDGLPDGAVDMEEMNTVLKTCAVDASVNFDYDKLDKCATGDDGKKFLAVEANKTPSHGGVPFTVINDGEVTMPPPDDLTAAVCAAYTGDLPAACTGKVEYVGYNYQLA
tara:strand:+ start:89 stop:811 length:723 start_codon:yes stop_codon:yes gene_type:complete